MQMTKLREIPMPALRTQKTQGGFAAPAARVILGAISVLGLVSALLVGGASVLSAQSRQGVAADAGDGPNRRAAIRFVTDTDYPPFNYYDEDGTLSGLNVDLAKALCLELASACDIQVRPWDDMVTAVKRNEADAVIASRVATAALLRDLDVSDRYYYTPARFVGLRETVVTEATPSGLSRRKIAVAKGSAHEAYLRAFFRLSEIQVYDNVELARDAVRNKTADLLFGDGIGLVFWLNGDASKLCCEFKGGPFTEQFYFGDGVGVLLSRADATLRPQINGALKRLRETGRIEELMLRYFPIRPY
jgi:polar amino acid transport system substrate-binding protein